MVWSACKYAASKYRRWFGILFMTFLVYSSFQVVVSKLLYAAGDVLYTKGLLTETGATLLSYTYEHIGVVLTYPLAIGIVRILRHLHENHRFNFNLIFTDFKSGKKLLNAWLLGILCVGIQALIDFTGNFIGGAEFQSMPMISGMLSAAFSIFIMLVPYLYVRKEDEQSAWKCWLESFRVSSHNLGQVGVIALVTTVLTMVVGTYGKFLAEGLTEAVFGSMLGAGTVTVIAALLHYAVGAMLMIFTEVAKYGFSRLVLAQESEDELMGLPPLKKED